MSSLLVFNRVYRLEVEPFMLVLSTGLWNIAPRTFSLVSSAPPPPFSLPYVNKYTVRGGGVWGHRKGGGLRQMKHLPQSPFTGKFFRLRHLLFYRSNLSPLLPKSNGLSQVSSDFFTLLLGVHAPMQDRSISCVRNLKQPRLPAFSHSPNIVERGQSEIYK